MKVKAMANTYSVGWHVSLKPDSNCHIFATIHHYELQSETSKWELMQLVQHQLLTYFFTAFAVSDLYASTAHFV